MGSFPSAAHQRDPCGSIGLLYRRCRCRCALPEGSAPLEVAGPARCQPHGNDRKGQRYGEGVQRVDPQRLSVWSEVIDRHQRVVATGRSGRTRPATRRHVADYRERARAVGGGDGTGRPLAQQLLADCGNVLKVTEGSPSE